MNFYPFSYVRMRFCPVFLHTVQVFCFGEWCGHFLIELFKCNLIPVFQEKEYVGFATLPNQVHRKSVKKGFDFTLMVAGDWCFLYHEACLSINEGAEMNRKYCKHVFYCFRRVWIRKVHPDQQSVPHRSVQRQKTTERWRCVSDFLIFRKQAFVDSLSDLRVCGLFL